MYQEHLNLSASQEMAYEPIVGEELAVVDEKGRVRLSVSKQEALGRGFVLYKDPLGCIAAYPKRIWQQKVGELLSKPANSWEREAETREIGANSETNVNADAHGRFVIPGRIRESVGIPANSKTEVTVVGAIDRAEIWLRDDYSRFIEARRELARKKQEFFASGADAGN